MEPEDLSLHHLVAGARTVTGQLPDEEDTLDRSPLEAQRITLQIEKELLQAERAFIVSRKQSIGNAGVGGSDDEGGEGTSGGVVADRTKEDVPGDDVSIGGDAPENGRPSARERETYSKERGGLLMHWDLLVKLPPSPPRARRRPSQQRRRRRRHRDHR
ncbi:SWR1-complex protein 4 [Anopheles sinensis]|uniref:SWR1-complex protein 4 n=1 Tax=Anopheles sinensis TaxID=74873 RepID=A0A084VS83_ANOSI|nr:SWR1-complex protein 4 [Anopheles sinensis]